MTQTPPDVLKALAMRFPRMNETKHRYAIDDLNRMVEFYKKTAKARNTSTIFSRYVITLVYVCSILKMYRKLTEELANLAGETTDELEDRTNSPRG